MLSPIVGSHFRPPAKLILSFLPSNTPLHLSPEPDHFADPGAVKVLLFPSEINLPASVTERLIESLPSCGWTLQQVVESDEIQLGYLPRTGAKTCQIAGRTYPGNTEVTAAIAASPNHSCHLTFAPSGEALVAINLGAPT